MAERRLPGKAAVPPASAARTMACPRVLSPQEPALSCATCLHLSQSKCQLSQKCARRLLIVRDATGPIATGHVRHRVCYCLSYHAASSLMALISGTLRNHGLRPEL